MKKVLGYILLSLGTIVFLIGTQLSVSFNTSNSLPHSAFLRFFNKHIDADFGRFVMTNHSMSKIPVAKQVKGVEGDRILIKNRSIYVLHKVGEISEKNSKGEPVSPIKSGVIPRGYVFLAGSNNKSFDSRYSSFGLVKKDQCRGIYAW
jgi:hypothetical protein